MHGRWIVGLLVAWNLAGCTTHMKTEAAAATGAPAGRAQIGAWGLDLTSSDTSVKPGDDFYRYAEGKWLDSNQIPPDRTSWGSFVELADRAEGQIRAIEESLPQDAPQGSTEQKAGDFYRAYLDTDTIERNGLTPARPCQAPRMLSVMRRGRACLNDSDSWIASESRRIATSGA